LHLFFALFEDGMSDSRERFRIAFWDELEQDASTVST
jgi:hypothetical protein